MKGAKEFFSPQEVGGGTRGELKKTVPKLGTEADRLLLKAAVPSHSLSPACTPDISSAYPRTQPLSYKFQSHTCILSHSRTYPY